MEFKIDFYGYVGGEISPADEEQKLITEDSAGVSLI